MYRKLIIIHILPNEALNNTLIFYNNGLKYILYETRRNKLKYLLIVNL